jgi:hypothetical protein
MGSIAQQLPIPRNQPFRFLHLMIFLINHHCENGSHSAMGVPVLVKISQSNLEVPGVKLNRLHFFTDANSNLGTDDFEWPWFLVTNLLLVERQQSTQFQEPQMTAQCLLKPNVFPNAKRFSNSVWEIRSRNGIKFVR